MIKAKIMVMAMFFMMFCSPPVHTENKPADNTTDTDTSRDSMELPPPPDSAYIARASDSQWWKRKIENRAFDVGEYLEFGVNYGIIPAGTAVMRVAEEIEYNGFKCFKVISAAHSNAFVSAFYRVEDTVISHIDYNGIFTHYFSKRLREGKYRADRETFFDQRQHLAITGKDTIPTYSFVQDAFSALYFARTQEIKPGLDLSIDNHTDKKNYPLKIIVHGKETIKVPAGKFDCIVVEPVMRAEGIFKAKGKIKIWLTDDRYKMPVKMQTEVFFLGSISAKLKEFRYGDFSGDTLKTADNSGNE
jgi:hypothetical protein